MAAFSIKRILYLLLAVVLLGFCSNYLPQLAKTRVEKQLISRETLEGVPPAYALADGLLGGFRGFLISSLWQRGQEKKQAGQFYEMVDIYRIISTMEPNYANAWANMAWDLSYNVAAEFSGDPRERLFWIFKGINMLRNEAVRHNPRSARLYFELGWIFYNKATNSVDPAYPLYRQYIAREMMEVLWGSGDEKQLTEVVNAAKKYPTFEDLLVIPGMASLKDQLQKLGYTLNKDAARILVTQPKNTQEIVAQLKNKQLLRTAALWQMNQQLHDRFNMSAEAMLDLDKRFGNIDWRLPQAHSLYWAWLGQKYFEVESPESSDMRYERLIYFSLIQLAHKGTGLLTKEGMMIASPNPAMVDKAIDYIKGLLEKHGLTAKTGGVRAGLENFMRVTVFNYYFEDDRLNAQRILQKLLDLTEDKTKYDVTLTQFINREMPDFIDGVEGDRSIALLASFCNRAYWYLTNGNLTKYQEIMGWFEQYYVGLYKDWESRFTGTFEWRQQFGMPEPDVLRAQLAANIINGGSGYTPQQISNFKSALQKVLPKVWTLIEAQLKAQEQEFDPNANSIPPLDNKQPEEKKKTTSK